MLESQAHALSHDVDTLVTDAHALLSAAATLSGEKAEEARAKALSLLDIARSRAANARAKVIVAGKQAAASSDRYVHENPWRSIGIAAGVGLLLGVVVGRSCA